MNLFASRDDLVRWLGLLIDERIVIAPVQVEGLTLFQPISKPEEVALDFDNSTLPPKGWFFPPYRDPFLGAEEQWADQAGASHSGKRRGHLRSAPLRC